MVRKNKCKVKRPAQKSTVCSKLKADNPLEKPVPDKVLDLQCFHN